MPLSRTFSEYPTCINFSRYYATIIRSRNAPMEKRIEVLFQVKNSCRWKTLSITRMRCLNRIMRMQCLDIRDTQRPRVDDVQYLLFVAILVKMSALRIASIGMSGLTR